MDLFFLRSIFFKCKKLTKTRQIHQNYCPLCERIITQNSPQSLHHLVPKSKGGKKGETVLLHHICHKQIHLMFKEKELAKSLNKIETLKNHPKLKKFINWIKKRPPGFLSKTYKINRNKY